MFFGRLLFRDHCLYIEMAGGGEDPCRFACSHYLLPELHRQMFQPVNRPSEYVKMY
jgi:hypothetical protein